MKLVTRADTDTRSPQRENAPTISVYFGAEGDSDAIGLIRIQVPPHGGGMPPHRHNGSDIVIAPIIGSVVIATAAETLEVKVGDAIQILRDESVSLSNPGSEPAEVLVAAGPADFIRQGVLAMPEA